MYLGVQISSLPLFFYDNYKFRTRIEKVLALGNQLLIEAIETVCAL